jgi:hypothetical protein
MSRCLRPDTRGDSSQVGQESQSECPNERISLSVVLPGVVLVGLFAVSAALVPSPGGAARSAAACRAHGGLPDRSCTPGTRDPHVKQSNVKSTICRSGYTATVRPPSSYTTALKKQQMAEYGYYAGHSTANYEEDHLISLELGGGATDSRNLWPEAYKPRPGARQKDVIEGDLHRQVCAGEITLAVAQRREARNWGRVYRQLHP